MLDVLCYKVFTLLIFNLSARVLASPSLCNEAQGMFTVSD